MDRLTHRPFGANIALTPYGMYSVVLAKAMISFRPTLCPQKNYNSTDSSLW